MTDQSHTPLLPCPFCGSPANWVGTFETDVFCTKCGVEMEQHSAESFPDLIARWNTRSDSLPSLVKALEEIIKHVVAMRANRPSEGLDNIERIALNALSSYRGEGK